MRTHRPRSSFPPVILATLLGLVWVGCDETTGPVATISPGLTECGGSNVFDRRDFSPASTMIDNRWMPLIPGTAFILDGVANRGGGLLPHRVIFTVTNLTKDIGGVNTVVLWDRDYTDGHLQEAELAFFAQDDEGSVWVMGEYPEEYENDVFIGAPSTWIATYSGADAGIILPGRKKLESTSPFLQGWAPDVNFLDCGRVFSRGGTVCVPYSCYENAVVIDEWSPLDVAAAHQRKYYAPGVGNVSIGAVDDPEGETLVLVNILRLTPEELAEARKETLKLEARAYEINDVYRHTAPCR